MKRFAFFMLVSAYVSGQTSERVWIIPDYTKIQYAGSIGLLSFGPGYYLCKQRLETELMFGFTPVESRDDFYNLTWKINYKPFNFTFAEDYSTTGIYCGLYNSITFGENYWILPPDKYPKGYYNTLPGLRTGFYLGTSISKINGESKKRTELFFECSTYDRLVLIYIENTKVIPLEDIIKLGLGIRVDI